MVAACPFPAAFASSGLIRELSIELARRGHDIHVVTYHLGLTGFNTTGLTIHRIPNVPFYRKISSGVSPGKPILDLLLARELNRIIRRNRIDLIHAHNYEAPAAALLCRLFSRIPLVYHAHNTMWHELPSYFTSRATQFAARRFGRVLDLTLPRHADHVISLSGIQTDYLVECGVPRDRITLIEPAIDATAFQGGDGFRIRRILGLDDDPILIYTGGLQPYQNCTALIDLLARVLPVFPSAQLIILARSSRTDIEQLARIRGVLDHIRFVHTLSLDEERDYLAAADVAILPRLHCIGFPIKLLNYLASGLPVVCFNSVVESLPGCPGVHAVTSGDIDAMAEKTIRLLRDRHSIGIKAESGRLFVRERFGWKDKIDAIETVYRQIMSVERD